MNWKGLVRLTAYVLAMAVDVVAKLRVYWERCTRGREVHPRVICKAWPRSQMFGKERIVVHRSDYWL